MYIVPDSGISDFQVVNTLLGRLDGPQSRAALAAAPQEGQTESPRVVSTAPKRIYLQVSDDEDHLAEDFPDAWDEVTWCQESVMQCEVAYVRADLAAPPPAVAQEERQDWADWIEAAKLDLSEVLHLAPGYDWNLDPRSLTLKTGGIFASLDKLAEYLAAPAAVARQEERARCHECGSLVDRPAERKDTQVAPEMNSEITGTNERSIGRVTESDESRHRIPRANPDLSTTVARQEEHSDDPTCGNSATLPLSRK